MAEPSSPTSGRFSALLLEGLDHYRKGKMMEAVRAWEEAYLLEPTNLRAREFLRSALERIHAHLGADDPAPPPPGSAFAQAPVQPPKEAVPYGHPLPGAGPFVQHPKGNTDPLARLPPQYDEADAFPPMTPHPWLKPQLDVPPPAQPAPRPANPWDNGPSIALQSEQGAALGAGGPDAGAWAIHSDPLPITEAKADETEIWMRGARELLALNDFSGALELANKILVKRPQDREAMALNRACEENLTQMYESRMGSMDRRPRVVLKPDEIIWLNLDPRAGFVLAQIDGEVSFEDLYSICGLSRLDTARILSQLLEEGVIAAEAGAMAARATR